MPLLESVIMRLLSGVLGPAAELARRNLERHRRRNTTTALMFILSVSLVIFVASLVVLFSRMSMTMVEHFNGADLRLQSDEAGALGLKTELAGVTAVDRVSEVHLLRSRTERGTAYDVVLSDLVGMKQLWLVPFGVDEDLPRVLTPIRSGMPTAGSRVCCAWPTTNRPRPPLAAPTKRRRSS